MRRAPLPFVLLLACSSPLFALEIFPPAPDSHTYVTMLTKTSFCAVQSANASLSGSTITVTVVPILAPCAVGQFPLAANIGVVPPGVYDLVVRTDAAELERSKIIVRDADSGILVSPVGVPAEGGRKVQVFGAASNATVSFDGVAATDAQVVNGALVATPPPHAPATVDVTVTDGSGTRKAVAALTYFDPNAAPTPFVFEPLLFPVAYDGAGAFGSQWETDNVMATGNTLVRLRQPLPARSCDGDCSRFNWSAVLAPDSPSGLLVWVVRRRLPAGTIDDFRVASRITAISRPDVPSTALPVAREHDFRTSFVIEDVPLTRAGARVALRLYALSDAKTTANVLINGGAKQSVTLVPLNGVAFATVDLTPATADGTQRMSVAVSGDTRMWALVTVTNNATQAVTAVWPQ